MSQSERARQLATATLGYTSAALAASELVSRLTTDAAAFIDAEPDAPIPDSIKQAVRLVNTPELEECAARVSSGVARGVAGAASAAMGGGDGGAGDADAGPSAAERVVDKLLDPRNWGVVSVLVGGATRQTLETIIDVWRESTRRNDEESSPENGDAPSALESALESALRVAASDDGKSVLLDVCSTFVSQMVGTYLDKTAGSNAFDDFFAAALAASNREAFGDIAGRVTGEAVRAAAEAVSPTAAAASRRAQQRAARRDGDEGSNEEDTGSLLDTFSDDRVTDGDPSVARDSRGAERRRDRDSARRLRLGGLETCSRIRRATSSPDPDASPPSADSEETEETRPTSHRERRRLADGGDGGRLRRRIGRVGESPESAAEAAAAFTSALVNDAAPRVFAAFASPDGRRLAADVAGTCAASATRSFVLSVRDAVFFVDSREKRGFGKRDAFKAKAADAARVALAAVFLLWITASALASLVAIARFLGWNTAQVAADALELRDVAPAAEQVVKSGWWVTG